MRELTFNGFLKRYVRELKELGIMFNYTMNSIFPYGSKKELLEHKQEVINFVKYDGNWKLMIK